MFVVREGDEEVSPLHMDASQGHDQSKDHYPDSETEAEQQQQQPLEDIIDQVSTVLQCG